MRLPGRRAGRGGAFASRAVPAARPGHCREGGRATAGGSGAGRGAETPPAPLPTPLPLDTRPGSCGREVGLLELPDCPLPGSPRASVRSVQTGQLLSDGLI